MLLQFELKRKPFPACLHEAAFGYFFLEIVVNTSEVFGLKPAKKLVEAIYSIFQTAPNPSESWEENPPPTQWGRQRYSHLLFQERVTLSYSQTIYNLSYISF